MKMMDIPMVLWMIVIASILFMACWTPTCWGDALFDQTMSLVFDLQKVAIYFMATSILVFWSPGGLCCFLPAWGL